MTIFAVAVSAAGLLVHQFLIPTLDQFERLGKFGQGVWLTIAGGLIILLAFGLFRLVFRAKTTIGENLTT